MPPKPLAHLVLCGCLLTVLTFSGCGKSPEAAPSKESDSPSSSQAKSSAPVKEFEVTGDDQMKFNVTELEVQPGQRVQITFKNVGTMPKQSMGHNLVLLKEGTDDAAFIEAGFASAGTDYIAADVKDQVIASTKILGPGETATLRFTAPSKPGSYTYVCTFPGHFAAGMHGVLIVK